MHDRWLTPRALLCHLLLALLVPLCLLAGWWQLHQALGGNSLSWAYTVEWPVFAVLAVVGWWQLIHENPAERALRAAGAATTVSLDPGDLSEVDLDNVAAGAVDGDKVAAAARHEYSLHLAQLSEREATTNWRSSRHVR